MTGIAIFENNAEMAEGMKVYIDNYLKKLNVSYFIDIFISREDLLPMTVRKGGYDVVFLDVDLQDGIGTRLAENIRIYTKDGLLVLISGSLEYAIEGYKLGAIRYILKQGSSFGEDMDECMRTVLDKLRIDPRYKEFDFLEGKKNVQLHNIIYIESNLHKVIFYIWENGIKKYTKYAGINEVTEELLPYDFTRIHKSFLINMFYMTQLGRYKAFLRFDISLPVSKNRYKEIEDRFLTYKNKNYFDFS